MSEPRSTPDGSGCFDPILLTEDQVGDLVSFTGLSRQAVEERLRSYSVDEMADAWRRVAPQTSDELIAFYRAADNYIWELMQWHASAHRGAYRDALNWLAHHCPADSGWQRVYDFGCGIGSDALFLAEHGYDVTLVDVDGPVFRFAKHRFERRGLTANFVESRSVLPEPDGTYDVVICFDVLEHLPDPLEAARRLVAGLRSGGVFLQRATFDDADRHPCHLERGIQRFAGMRWTAQLAGLGLKSVGPLAWARTSGMANLLQRWRFRFWSLSGLWVMKLRR